MMAYLKHQMSEHIDGPIDEPALCDFKLNDHFVYA